MATAVQLRTVMNTTVAHDANCNRLTNGQTAFIKPETITRGSATIGFAHDSEHQRFKQVSGQALFALSSG